MKKLFYIVGCLLMLGSSPVMAAADDPAVVVVRVYETSSTVRLVIARGTDAPEVVDFVGGRSDKAMKAAAIQYQRYIAKFYEQGYALQGQVDGYHDKDTFDDVAVLSTLIFVKAAKP
jgi:hypothetical protein